MGGPATGWPIVGVLVRGFKNMASAAKLLLCFLLVSMLVLSAVPAIAGFGCLDDCIDRCSNGNNLESCARMCTEACLPLGGH